MRLHHLHAAAQATRVEFHGIRPAMIWRADGNASLEIKGRTARRLAVCWNVLEGIPTEALETGMLLEVFEAIAAGDLERAQRAAAQVEAAVELTDNGKPHACESCP
jgi:hypothetical protein